MMQTSFQNAPRGFLLPHELTGLPPETPILVAFSGGADSTLLLSLMATYGKIYGAPVYAAHFHHGIRGDEADRDRVFCQAVADQTGVPLFTEEADIPALAAASGRSLELEARLARYAFFKKLMTKHNIPLLLTAHHANDQLETLLLRFLRGSGTKGMGGIRPVRRFGNGFVARPLLNCSKDDILTACQALGLSYVTDSTNRENDAARNRLRHHLVPLMAELTDHGAPTEAALRLSANAREDEDFLSAMAEQAFLSCARGDGSLCRKSLAALHSAVGKRVLSHAFSLALANTDNSASSPLEDDGRYTLSSLHLDALWELTQKGQTGQQLHLPRQMRGILTRDALTFTLHPHEPRIPSEGNLPVPLSLGLWDWDGGRMGILLREAEDSSPVAGEVVAEATFPTSVLPLTVRRREFGDTIVSHGMHKKLKKLLCDKNIPRDMRDRLPLVCYGEARTPLWYPTVAFADGFPPPPEGEGIKITIFYQNPPKGNDL